MRHLTIAIADDHQLFTDTLSTALSRDYRVLFVARSGVELMSALERVQPDVLLLDLNMPEMDGLTVLPKIKSRWPDTRVIIVTMYDNAKFIKAAFREKSDGYFIKSNGLDALAAAIEAVMDGQRYLSEGLRVFPKEGTETTPATFTDDFQMRHQLTPREMEILKLITQAKTNKQIAVDLFISDQTVGVHRKNIMRKLNVSTSAGLIKFALQYKLRE